MSKTVDELVRVYCDAFYAQRDKAPAEGITQADRAGIIAVVTALRDEILRDYGGNNHSWCERVALGAINEILAPREGGGREAGGALGAQGGVEPLPADASYCTPAAPAPAVCEWTDVGDAYRSACGRSHFAWTSRDGVVVCPHCKAPIKFTEAK